ncbi:hypothetical protein E2C01_098636 [Portunus trituberculatus]|uniref:Uncharacterized protein n=1 Tax=Portunus trituberculatus TaxID=210409 RepID=A0A5B7K1Q4_PORTR|nr:hypothetical protein [Portunus trituberculatus]
MCWLPPNEAVSVSVAFKAGLCVQQHHCCRSRATRRTPIAINARRLPRNAALTDLIYRALAAVDLVAILETRSLD